MRRLLVLILLLLPGLALADDRGYLTGLLEDNLSGAGRKVTITGFEGALSSRATIQELTIADDQGIWLDLKGVTLDWSRSALLSGRVEVNALTAEEITLSRLPAAAPAPAGLPAPEATPFRLPDLPVSVSIAKLSAARVVLGAPVLGQAAVVSVAGALSLAGGEGKASLALDRLDGPQGKIALDAGFANATGILALDLQVQEAAGGLITSLAGLPGAPAIALSLAGTGPLDDYTAELRLATGGEERLHGMLTLRGTEDGARRFSATVAGNIAPLFAPDYAAFFGPNVTLALDGRRAADGAVEIGQLELGAERLHLSGTLSLGADGAPRRFALAGRIDAGGAPVLLPLTGTRTTVTGATIALGFDAAQGDGWTGSALVTGLARADLAAAMLRLDGSGHIAGAVADGTLTLDARGLAPADTALAAALGSALSGSVGFRRMPDAPFAITALSLGGPSLTLSGTAEIDTAGGEPVITAALKLAAADLARFSGLAGRKLGGSGTIAAEGRVSPLSGGFDLRTEIDGTDISLDQKEADALLRGQARISIDAARDAAGLTLRSLKATAEGLALAASGAVGSTAGDLTATLSAADLSRLGAPYRGSLSARAHLTRKDGIEALELSADTADIALGQPQADTLLAGKTALSLALHRANGLLTLDRLDLASPLLTAKARGEAQRASFEARLADLARLVPGYPGALTLSGTLAASGAGYDLDVAAKGPAAIDARAKGRLAADFTSADLAVTGSAQAELANPVIAPRVVSGPLSFDLRLKGAPALAALSGRIALSGGRLAEPVLGLTAENLDAGITLSGGRAQVSVGATVGGGTLSVSGPVGLDAPYVATLAVTLAHVGLKDPALYATTVDGSLSATGPLAGGARIAGTLRLGDTELRVPSTGLGGTGALAELQHTNTPPAVAATLDRAGFGKTAEAPSAPSRPFALDIRIDAPNRVFIRGRGLDAELGGRISLGGTSADIRPAGGLNLIRGRLDILGKRFTLDEGSLALQGRFVPSVHLAASSSNDGVTSTVTVEGDATDPTITFSSTPELPQEEVLARLLFGRSLTTLSAFQAAQLASAVATLAGKGGEGIVAKLRQGFGLDDLDVSQTDEGKTAVTAGKYLSRNLYSDVTVDSDGKSTINLNLDVGRSVKLRGSVGSDGNTGIGAFYERDY